MQMNKLAYILIFFLGSAVSLPAQTPHNAKITWNASVDAAANPSLGYNVYKFVGTCTASGTPVFTKVNSAPISALTFTDSPLAIGSVCYYVTAVLNGSESVPSNIASGEVKPGSVTINITVN